MLGNRSKDRSKNFTGKVDSREMSIFNDPNFDEIIAGIVYDSRVQSPDCDVIESIEVDEWEDDGQPTHYEECQDLYGGDDYMEQWEVESWD